jgi:hypothetical protein
MRVYLICVPSKEFAAIKNINLHTTIYLHARTRLVLGRRHLAHSWHSEHGEWSRRPRTSLCSDDTNKELSALKDTVRINHTFVTFSIKLK